MPRPAVLLAVLALAACRDDPQAALLQGTWLCTLQTPDFAMTRGVTYEEGGKLSGRTNVQSTDAQTPVAMQFSFSGTWRLADGTLTEQLETHRLMRFSRDGANVPLTELAPGAITEIESSLADQSATYGIGSVSAETLLLRDTEQGIETVCGRS